MTSTEIEITRGDTRTYEITVTRVSDGSAQPLEDGTLVVTAKLRRSDAEALFVKTPGDGIEYSDTEGLAVLTIDGDDLTDVDNWWTTLVADARFFVDGEPKTPLEFVIRVRPSVGSDVEPDES